MKDSGCAGLSLGVLHCGERVYTANFGYRDVGKKLAVDDETVFPTCSLTKAMISIVMGMLVDEGKVEWDTRLSEVMPEFHIKGDTIRNCTTVTDLLAHRTACQLRTAGSAATTTSSSRKTTR